MNAAIENNAVVVHSDGGDTNDDTPLPNLTDMPLEDTLVQSENATPGSWNVSKNINEDHDNADNQASNSETGSGAKTSSDGDGANMSTRIDTDNRMNSSTSSTKIKSDPLIRHTNIHPHFQMDDYNYQKHSQKQNNLDPIHHNPLNLSNDVKLCTLLQSLSHHVQKRTSDLSSSLSKLESKLQQVDYNVNRIIMIDSIHSDHQSMLFHVAADDDNYDNNKYNKEPRSNSDNQNNIVDKINGNDNPPENENYDQIKPEDHHQNDSGLDKMQKEEDDAIQSGIEALSIFHDPSAGMNNNTAVGGGGGPDHYFGIDEEEDEEDEEDSFYYYESSPGDIFNQRPLPFVVGSVEFLNSVDGGIGGDVVMEDEEKESDYDDEEEEDDDDDSDY